MLRIGKYSINKLTRFQLVYIISLVILVVVLIFAVLKPFASGGQYTEISRESLLNKDDEWILQFDISNHEGKDILYVLHTEIAGQDYQEAFMVKAEGKFTYIHHIKKADAGNQQVIYRIYKENESNPLEQGVYYLK
jgi:hypothetical protein